MIRSINEIQMLLNKLSSNRNDLDDMLKTLSNIRQSSEKIFSSDKDFRNRYILDNKLKVLSELYKNELAVRKEINDSIKMEIDLSMKISSSLGETEDNITIDEVDRVCDILENLNKDSQKN